MAPTALLVAKSNKASSHLTRKLEQTGIFGGIIPFHCGTDALHHLEQHQADMLFCALDSESHESLAWADALWQNEDLQDLPLVAVTREADQEGRIHSLENGATDCITFETHAEEMAARIQAVLKRQQMILELREATQQLTQLAQTDPLTGLGNRAYFDRAIEQEAARTVRSKAPFTLLMIDIDHFKQLNDNYGHQTGDQVLRAVANVLQNSARTSDMVCRYGGEEFALILPETTAPKAIILADRIHKNLVLLNRELRNIDPPITVSIGIKCASGKAPIHHQQVIEAADQALYKAKRNGRNRTEVAASSTPVLDLQNHSAIGRA